MSPAQLLQVLRSRPGLVSWRVADGTLNVEVEAGALRGLLTFLRDELRFDHLAFLTALDHPAESRLEVVYRLFAYASKTAAVARVSLPREAARVDSVCDLYRAAEWHERETAEMFGIVFAGHPDPRRLLLPDELEGHPLRKDFTHENLRPLPEVS